MTRGSTPSRRTLLGLAPALLAGSALPLAAAGTSRAAGRDHSLPDRAARRAAASAGAADTVIGTDAWSAGTPAAPGPTVPRDLLLQLPGGPGGPEMFVSNNPETFTGPGWLAQCGRTTANRGGAAHPLSGTFPVYLYHQNRTGATAWLHVLASNPGTAPVTVSARGSVWTNADKPLVQDPAQRAGTGPCYATSLDWATGSLRDYLAPTSVAPRTMVEIARIPLTSSIADGLLEVTASGGVYVYTAATADGSTAAAINSTQHDDQAAPGDIASQTATTYGREAGVYAASRWDTGTVAVDVPEAGRYLGLAVNTTVRQRAELDQTVPATAALSDSSQRSWGNYGMRYAVALRLRNPSGTARTVALTFGSNVTGTVDVPGDTWNGAATLRVDGGTAQVRTVYVRPTVPRCGLGSFLLPAGGETLLELDFEVPGLITAGSQLLLESV
ncbi:DUF3370 domain-containing protein [Streptacidiphilus sp. ASG 303]|uniref:DUF3370 family protein n=1 Tax=Streptacidiphilus sp. ASG 303 TaxID=2896847 RepID=UPI001E62657E|nr:DUF3370 family protein [Streptacidiphilus sp. ASG 303]MCD0484261.1 DUF3370 domain-containing protein [Streptacidiphilus sp. ASG 303]